MGFVDVFDSSCIKKGSIIHERKLEVVLPLSSKVALILVIGVYFEPCERQQLTGELEKEMWPTSCCHLFSYTTIFCTCVISVWYHVESTK